MSEAPPPPPPAPVDKAAWRDDPFALPPRPKKRRWPRILAIVAGVLVLLALLAPKLIPSGPVRDLVVREASAALGGRTVELDHVGFGWWSGVRLRGLVVHGATPEAPPLLRAGELYADAKLWPLISGRVEGVAVTARNVDVRATPADLALLGQTPPTDAVWSLAWRLESLAVDLPALDRPAHVTGRLVALDGDAASTGGGVGIEGRARVLKGAFPDVAVDLEHGEATLTLRVERLDAALLDRQLGLALMDAGFVDGQAVARVAEGRAVLEEAEFRVEGLQLAAGAAPWPALSVAPTAEVDLQSLQAIVNIKHIRAGDWFEAVGASSATVDLQRARLLTPLALDGRLTGPAALDFARAQGWVGDLPFTDLSAPLAFTMTAEQTGEVGAGESVRASLVFKSPSPVSATLTGASGFPGSVSLDLGGRGAVATLPGYDPGRMEARVDLGELRVNHAAPGAATPVAMEFARGTTAEYLAGARPFVGDAPVKVTPAGEKLRAAAYAQPGERVTFRGGADLVLPAGNAYTREATTLTVALKNAQYDLNTGWMRLENLTVGEKGQPPVLQQPGVVEGVFLPDTARVDVKEALGSLADRVPFYAEFGLTPTWTASLDITRLFSLAPKDLIAAVVDARGRVATQFAVLAHPAEIQLFYNAQLADVAVTIPWAAAAGAAAPSTLTLAPPAPNQSVGTVAYAPATGRVSIPAATEAQKDNPPKVSLLSGPLRVDLASGVFDPATGSASDVRYGGAFDTAQAGPWLEQAAAIDPSIPSLLAMLRQTLQFRGRANYDGARVQFDELPMVYGQLVGPDAARPLQFQIHHNATVTLPTGQDPWLGLVIPERPAAYPQYPSFAALAAGDDGQTTLGLELKPGTARLNFEQAIPRVDGILDLTGWMRLPSVAPYAREGYKSLPESLRAEWKGLHDHLLSRYDVAAQVAFSARSDAQGVALQPPTGQITLVRGAGEGRPAATVAQIDLPAPAASGAEGAANAATGWRIDPTFTQFAGQSDVKAAVSLTDLYYLMNDAVPALPDAWLADVDAAGNPVAGSAARNRAMLAQTAASWPMAGVWRASARGAATAGQPLRLVAQTQLENAVVGQRDPATQQTAEMFRNRLTQITVDAEFDPVQQTVLVRQAEGFLSDPEGKAQALGFRLATAEAPVTVALPMEGRPAMAFEARPQVSLYNAPAVQASFPGPLAGMKLDGQLDAGMHVRLDGDVLTVADGRAETSTGFLVRLGEDAQALTVRMNASGARPATFGATVNLAAAPVEIRNADFASLATLSVRDAKASLPTLDLFMATTDGQTRQFQITDAQAALTLEQGVLTLTSLGAKAAPVLSGAAGGSGALKSASLAMAGTADLRPAEPVYDFQLALRDAPIPELTTGMLPDLVRVEDGTLNFPAQADRRFRIRAQGLTPEAVVRTMEITDANFHVAQLNVLSTLPADQKFEGLDGLTSKLKGLSTLSSVTGAVGSLTGGGSTQDKITGVVGNLFGRNTGTSSSGTGTDSSTSGTGGLLADPAKAMMGILRFDDNRQRRIVFTSITGGLLKEVAGGRIFLVIDPNNPLTLTGDDNMADLRVHGRIAVDDNDFMQSRLDLTAEITGTKMNKLFDVEKMLDLFLGLFTGSFGQDSIRGLSSADLAKSMSDQIAAAVNKKAKLSFPVKGTLAAPDVVSGASHFANELMEEAFVGMGTALLKNEVTRRAGLTGDSSTGSSTGMGTGVTNAVGGLLNTLTGGGTSSTTPSTDGTSTEGGGTSSRTGNVGNALRGIFGR